MTDLDAMHLGRVSKGINIVHLNYHTMIINDLKSDLRTYLQEMWRQADCDRLNGAVASALSVAVTAMVKKAETVVRAITRGDVGKARDTLDNSNCLAGQDTDARDAHQVNVDLFVFCFILDANDQDVCPSARLPDGFLLKSPPNHPWLRCYLLGNPKNPQGLACWLSTAPGGSARSSLRSSYHSRSRHPLLS